MNRANTLIRVSLTLLLVMLASAANGQKMYKWVDEEGNVHYSDKIPPEEVERQRTQLNEQGVAVDEVERALTAEELAAAQEKQRQEELEQRRIEMQRKEDERILRAFTSEDDIARRRDSRIEAIQRNIELTESALEAQRKRMSLLREAAADHERAGEQVPQELISEIEELGTRIEEQRQFLNERHGEMAQVQEDYMAQLEHFRAARKRLGYDKE